jgi:hypothetical protein
VSWILDLVNLAEFCCYFFFFSPFLSSILCFVWFLGKGGGKARLMRENWQILSLIRKNKGGKFASFFVCVKVVKSALNLKVRSVDVKN